MILQTLYLIPSNNTGPDQMPQCMAKASMFFKWTTDQIQTLLAEIKEDQGSLLRSLLM